MRASFEIMNRRIVRNDSWRSAESSLRLNQDILPAKIEIKPEVSGPPVQKLGSHHSSDSLDKHEGDYGATAKTVLVQKLNLEQQPLKGHNSEIMSNKWGSSQELAVKREEGSKLMTVYATMEAEKPLVVEEGKSPVKTRGSSPKRKSVLSRASKVSPEGAPGSPPKLRYKHH